ncbi:MAG TPA: glucuronate isomerase, partial [Bacillota bacterium]|nr:glucuronate isomerase [Bacillota bacterium]
MMRNPDFLLESKTAKSLHEHCKNLPVIDYHCHLSPKEIYEDKEFDNIGEMWLRYDHYKWRLMRICGIPEEKITGNAPWQEKF